MEVPIATLTLDQKPEPKSDGPRVNREITAPSVRVIDADGEMVGIVPLAEGMRLALDAGLDLVEVSPNAEPPVCKLIDYGKFKYEAQKKAAEARKKSKTVEIKEIKFRPGTDDNDYGVKLRAMRRFIDDGDKVKVTLRFRGREMAHQDIGMRVLVRVREDLESVTKVEQMPKLEGKQMVMMLSPR